MELSPAARMEVAAVIDRMIFGSEAAIQLEDATRLFELVKALPDSNDGISLSVRGGGSSARGYAAGFGEVELREDSHDHKIIDLSGPVLRAGQWKLRRTRESWLESVLRLKRRAHFIEITQVIGGHEGGLESTVVLEFDALGSPAGSWIHAHSSIRIPLPFTNSSFQLTSTKPVPWRPIAGAGGGTASGARRRYFSIVG